MHREDDASGSPVALAQARAQGAAPHSGAEGEAMGPRFREDDERDLMQRETPAFMAAAAASSAGKHPMHREDDAGGSPVALAQARAQGGAPHSAPEGEALDPRSREDDKQDLMQRERTGPLRNGNPRGNPNLAPRCGARTRRTGCPCRAPAMRNGRCRLHGGKSTGPRPLEGRARIAGSNRMRGQRKP
jgi:hypothetical protein